MVDASCLVELLVGGAGGEPVRARLALDPEPVAPHVIDVEVLGAVRDLRIRDVIDETTALYAIENLRMWPGERFGHRALLDRAWDLRHTVRSWDAMYVALAEALDVPVITRDARLAAASGPTCAIELVG